MSGIAARCAQVRELAFDYRAAELSDADMTRVSAHLATCHACATYVGRLSNLLDAPDLAAEAAVQAVDTDALFRRITGALEPGGDTSAIARVGQDVHSTSPFSLGDLPEHTLAFDASRETAEPDVVGDHAGPPLSAPSVSDTPMGPWSDGGRDYGDGDEGEHRDDHRDDRPDGDELYHHPRSRSFALVAAMAAVLAAALAFGLWQSGRSGESAPELAVVDSLPEGPVLARSVDLPRRAAPSRAVELRASDDAVWALTEPDEQHPERLLEITSGQVLVEFLPVDDAGLRVDTPDLDFVVVGTVFFVDLEGTGSVGVLAGAVELLTDEAPIRVEAGQRSTGGMPSPMPTNQREAIGAEVDLEMHEARLTVLRTISGARATEPDVVPSSAAARSGGDGPDGGSHVRVSDLPTRPTPERAIARAEPTPERSEPEVIDQRERADRAMSERRWADAADAYEALVAETGTRGPVRLDLARLYIRRLDAPARALPHLRAFVTGNAGDPTTDSALRELCRVAESQGIVEPLCP